MVFFYFFLKGLYFTSYIEVRDPLWIVNSVQSFSRAWLFSTPWIAALQASLSITNSWSLLKLMSIESVMPSNHLILCCPFSSCLQSFPASESIFCIRWPKYCSFRFSISPSNLELWVDFYVIPCVRFRLRFISVPVNIQHSSTNLLKRPSFLHGMALTLLSKISLTYLCGHLLSIHFAFLLF